MNIVIERDGILFCIRKIPQFIIKDRYYYILDKPAAFVEFDK